MCVAAAGTDRMTVTVYPNHTLPPHPDGDVQLVALWPSLDVEVWWFVADPVVEAALRNYFRVNWRALVLPPPQRVERRVRQADLSTCRWGRIALARDGSHCEILDKCDKMKAE